MDTKKWCLPVQLLRAEVAIIKTLGIEKYFQYLLINGLEDAEYSPVYVCGCRVICLDPQLFRCHPRQLARLKIRVGYKYGRCATCRIR